MDHLNYGINIVNESGAMKTSLGSLFNLILPRSWFNAVRETKSRTKNIAFNGTKYNKSRFLEPLS